MTDIIAPPISQPPLQLLVAAFTSSISGLVFTQANKQGKQQIKINSTSNNNFVTLMCTLQVIKKKGRLVVRGDLQKEHEYTETFAPTSRFNTLRALMSVTVQQQLKLVQFDIKGAFMVSSIEDKDIYIALPPGYEVPKGFTTKLSSSLYGCRDSVFRFHCTLSTWMVDYGFEP
eukprot:1929593-Rhodomonas_salina.1